MKITKTDITKLEARAEQLKNIAQRNKSLTKEERAELAEVTRKILYFYSPPER